jgi:hypothetical protein
MDLAPPDLFWLAMPTFCRHNHLVQNCPICSREQDVEPRPLVSSSAPRAAGVATTPRGGSESSTPAVRRSSGRLAGSGGRGTGGGAVIVRRARSTTDDGYRSSAVPGLKSSIEAQRLAEELAFAQARLTQLEQAPPGLYNEVADPSGDLEERTWLAFLIAYLCPVEGDDPFAAIRSVRTSWGGQELPSLEGVQTGSRTAHEPGAGSRTLLAYRRWVQRAGSQGEAFRGDAGWTSDRRFARVFERLALPALNRGARFDLLVTLGRLGVYELRAGSLALGGADEVTLAAKRAFGIGDVLLLDRRATQLAQESEIALEAFDLGLFNWERGKRSRLGMGPDLAPDPALLQGISAVLGL